MEWIWFDFEAARGGSIPPVDLHLKAVAEKLINTLKKCGYTNILLPYPNKCGVRFKDIANKTGLGKIGDNYLFLHKEWGPWVHLRVIITDAEITDTLSSCNEVCTHCGACIKACPAKAIKKDSFNGHECGIYQNNEYKKGHAYEYQCEICIRACPIGNTPKEVKLTY